jgi:pimeloyl-ACP methyl ester carboxylesterase
MRASREWDVETDDGVRLHVQTWPAVQPGAPLVLALHGITANRLGFLNLIEALGGEVDFVAYDARGRGRSDKPSEPARYGHARHAADAACVLHALGNRPAVVVGQSMGAWDGLLLAGTRPDLVRAVVLGDGGYFRDLADDEDPADVVAGIMGQGWQDRLTLSFPSADLVIGGFRSLPAFAGAWDDAIETMLREGLEEQPDGTVRARCAAVAAVTDSLDYFVPRDRPAVKACLPDVTCPVHLVRAPTGFAISPETQEPLLPEPVVDAFRRELPQLTTETVPDTNHYTVNFGPAGTTAIAEAVRKALA